jgi:hypothetical protein
MHLLIAYVRIVSDAFVLLTAALAAVAGDWQTYGAFSAEAQARGLVGAY